MNQLAENAVRSALVSGNPSHRARRSNLGLSVHRRDYPAGNAGYRVYAREYRRALRKLDGFEPRGAKVVPMQRSDFPATPAGTQAYRLAYQADYRAIQKAKKPPRRPNKVPVSTSDYPRTPEGRRAYANAYGVAYRALKNPVTKAPA